MCHIGISPNPKTRLVVNKRFRINCGFSICEIAIIKPVDSDETAEYMLSFHPYGSNLQLYVILCDDVKKNINSE